MTDAILSLRHLRKRYGAATPADDFSIDIQRGEFFTMLGPSGSGKSTILRMIAGLEQADSGTILIDGKDMTKVPPWHRHLGMVFQQYANFPHMTVGDNVAYGLRRQGLPAGEQRSRVAELLELVGLGGFEGRRVTQLSGGEQQRVAIARALAPNPTILLLDEPLSALDEKIRREMQVELRAIQHRTGTTFVYVTHDQEEALTMSDRIAVLNAGRYVQCDAPKDIFQRPRTPWVAMFFRGSNVLTADVAAAPGGARVRVAGNEVLVPSAPPADLAGAIAIRGEAIRFGSTSAASALRLPATVADVTYRGLYTSYLLALADGQQISATQTEAAALTRGDTVEIAIDAQDVVLLEQDRRPQARPQ